MKEKLVSLQEAASGVASGNRIVMSATLQRPPMALLRELIRRRLTGLRLIGVTTGDINFDILVGAGAAGVIDTCAVTLGEFARTAPNFARRVMAGQVRALDNT